MTTAPTPALSRASLAPLLLSLFALYVIWGSTYYAIRVALVDLPPLGMAGVRFLIAGGVLYAIERLRGRPRPTATHWAGGALMGLLLLGMGNGFVVLAQRSVASSLAAVAVASMPLFAGLWGRLFGQSPSRAEWFGLFVGFVGVVLLSGEGDLRASPLGAVLLLIAPASWAFGSVLSRRLTLATGFMGSAVQMLMGGVLLSVGALLHGERWPTQVGLPSLAALGYLIVFGSILAFSAYGYLLRNTRTAVATSYAYVNPVIAIAIGMSVGGEVISTRGLIGAGVILFGVVLVTFGKSRSVPVGTAAVSVQMAAGQGTELEAVIPSTATRGLDAAATIGEVDHRDLTPSGGALVASVGTSNAAGTEEAAAIPVGVLAPGADTPTGTPTGTPPKGP